MGLGSGSDSRRNAGAVAWCGTTGAAGDLGAERGVSVAGAARRKSGRVGQREQQGRDIVSHDLISI